MKMNFFSKIKLKSAKKMCQMTEPFIKRGSKILDLGCGSGIITKVFQEYFRAEILGVDIQDKRKFKIPFQLIDGKNLPFKKNSFDIVLINFVLHHTECPVKLISQSKEIAKRIIIFEDLPEGILSKIFCFFHGLFFNLFLQSKFQKLNFKKEKEWVETFEKIGLKILFKKQFKDPKLYPVKKILFVLERSAHSSVG